VANYKITFEANLSEGNVYALNKYFYAAMKEQMGIVVEGLKLEKAEDTEAEWVEIRKCKSGFSIVECSSCGYGTSASSHVPDTFVGSTKFCPACGKRMVNGYRGVENLGED
jgi:NADH pyrophosphatase NudC (nudix superfamily)